MAVRDLKVFGLSVAAVGLLVFGTGCSRSHPDVKNPPHQEKWPDQSEETQAKYANRLAPPKYQLISDGGHLYLDYDGNKFDVVKGDPNPIRVESDLEANMTVVMDGDRQVLRKELGTLMASVWSEKYQTLHFVTCTFGDSSLHDTGRDDRTRLWSWNRKEGLKLLLDSRGDMMAQDGSPREMRGSVDGESIIFQFIRNGKSERVEALVYHLDKPLISHYIVKTERHGNLNMDCCTLLDSRTLIEAGSKAKSIDLKSMQSKPVPFLDGAFPIVMFLGQPWALRFVGGKYEIVRFNSTLDKVEQTVEIPAKFPRPIRPPDYEDGGD